MMAALKYIFFLSLLFLGSCSHLSDNIPSIVDEFITTPDPLGHPAFSRAIKEAKKSIQMKMFHLTDKEIIQDLIDAKNRSVDVRVLLDGTSLSETKYQRTFETLKNAGVNARASSSCFSITHEKSMIVDTKKAFITSINLTNTAFLTRDFGVITRESGILEEMNTVFEADWKNSEQNTCYTPKLSSEFLLWSPVNAEARLVSLIKRANFHIEANVENLGNKNIEDALIERATNGVEIKLLVPQCDKNKNPFFNYPFMNRLALSNVKVKVMPHPSSEAKPYMHSKMLLIDETVAFVGSENFSNNSLLKARELGVIFLEEGPVEEIKKAFAHDWSMAILPVPPSKLGPDFCPEI